MFYVYKYTSPSNKQYIGITSNIKQRQKQHKSAATKGCNYHFARAIRKYGYENFNFEVLDEADVFELAVNLEKYYIRTLKTKSPNGYNITDGGEGTQGVIRSEHQRQEHSKFMKGRISPRKGVTVSVETRRKQSLAKKGKPSHRKGLKLEITPELHEKLSKAHMGCKAWNKGLNFTSEHLQNLKEARMYQCKAVKCLETGRIYETAREAAKLTGISRGAIYKNIKSNGKYKIYDFYTFIFV